MNRLKFDSSANRDFLTSGGQAERDGVGAKYTTFAGGV